METFGFDIWEMEMECLNLKLIFKVFLKKKIFIMFSEDMQSV